MEQQSLDDQEGSGFGNGGREDTEWTILQEILWASLAYNRMMVYRKGLSQKTTFQPLGVNCIRQIEDVTSTVKQGECGKGV